MEKISRNILHWPLCLGCSTTTSVQRPVVRTSVRTTALTSFVTTPASAPRCLRQLQVDSKSLRPGGMTIKNDFYKTFVQHGFLDMFQILSLFVHYQKQNNFLISMEQTFLCVKSNQNYDHEIFFANR